MTTMVGEKYFSGNVSKPEQQPLLPAQPPFFPVQIHWVLLLFPGGYFYRVTQKTKRLIIVSVLSLLVVSISAGIYLYNKGPLNVKNVQGIPVNADELYSLFTNDSILAGKRYTSRVLLVSGLVSGVSVNASQQKIVLIKTGIDGAYINCTLDEPAIDIAANQQIRIKGVCSGMGESDMGLGIPGDIYLTRCIVPGK